MCCFVLVRITFRARTSWSCEAPSTSRHTKAKHPVHDHFRGAKRPHLPVPGTSHRARETAGTRQRGLFRNGNLA